jgi:poly(3-hydroxybutyrate) depolymerase
VDSEHCQPTLNYGNDCTTLGAPYISKCSYDGAGVALQKLYGGNLNPRGSAVAANLLEVNQKKYMPSSTFGVPGLGDTAYVYVPSACQKGAKCSFHMDFHGCNQEPDAIGTEYVKNAGYLEWAETNNIIVLFPQAAKADLHENPEACFDWWGYVDSDYAFKTSKQMTTFRNMLSALASAGGILN